MRDLTLGNRYCLTLDRTQVDGRDLITDFSARGMYPAGPELQTPAPDEVARTLGSMVDKYVARDLFSGVILIAKDDEGIFEKAYGKASLAYDELCLKMCQPFRSAF